MIHYFLVMFQCIFLAFYVAFPYDAVSHLVSSANLRGNRKYIWHNEYPKWTYVLTSFVSWILACIQMAKLWIDQEFSRFVITQVLVMKYMAKGKKFSLTSIRQGMNNSSHPYRSYSMQLPIHALTSTTQIWLHAWLITSHRKLWEVGVGWVVVVVFQKHTRACKSKIS